MKARVKEGNSYGWLPPGTIVEVDESELDRVPWCLDAVADDVPLTGDLPVPVAVDSIPDRSAAQDQEQKSAPSVPVAGSAPAPVRKGKVK
jgi:hypothetical protein